ncbi:histone H2B-like [Cervus canadensis]|uniref:histone H2B-like n=1 Tax=Cervus canadensis TaxID=1574408 RepID=UPI001CA36704|nr:histone H2B-like [Cervus canadensis]
MAEPSSDNSEESLVAKETCTSEMEISEFSKPEPCDDEPRKAKKKTAKGRRRRRRRCCRRRRHSYRLNSSVSFATYFPRVLKQVHTGLSISHETLNIMDSFVKDMFERIAEEAGRLTRSSKRCTIMSEDIQTAVRLLLPGEMGKYAMSAATKSVIRYITHK